MVKNLNKVEKLKKKHNVNDLEALIAPKTNANLKIDTLNKNQDDGPSLISSRSKRENSTTPNKKINEVAMMMDRMLEASNLDEKTKKINEMTRILKKEQIEIENEIEKSEKKNCNDKKLYKKIHKFQKKFLLKILKKGFDTRQNLFSLF